MPPIFSVIGLSKTGKTTLIRRIIRELRSRGYKVGVIKHDPMDHGEIDRKYSDTANFWEEGCDAVVLSSPSKLAVFRRVGKDTPPEEIAPFCGDVDCLILEGYKKSEYPKIMIWTPEELTVNPKQLLAVVYHRKDEEKVLKRKKENDIPLLCIDNIKSIVELLEEEILKKEERRKNE